MQRWGLTARRGQANPPTVPPMRCSYDAARLSDNVRQIECWFSQLDVGQEALLKRPPMSAPVLVNRVHQGRQAARAGSKDRETLGGAA